MKNNTLTTMKPVNTALEIAQNSDSILFERVGKNMAIIMPKPEIPSWVWVSLAVRQVKRSEKECYEILGEPEPDAKTPGAVIRMAAQDTEKQFEWRVSKELMDKLSNLDEMAPFHIYEIMDHYGNLDEEIFNPDRLAETILNLSHIYNIQYLFTVMTDMQLEEVELIFASDDPTKNMLAYLKKEDHDAYGDED